MPRQNGDAKPRLAPPGEAPPAASLDALQRLMASAVMRPLVHGARADTQWLDGSSAAEVAAQFIKPNDRLSSFERLELYNQQYWWRLLGNFADDFRGLRAVLGRRRFDRLAEAYLAACPSTSFTMRDLGSKLEGFLREHPELTAPYSVLALDMVKVEWARVVAFDEAEEAPILVEAVAAVPADQLRMNLQPHLALLELEHPIDDLLLRLKNADIETGSLSNAVSATRSRRPTRLSARRALKPIFVAVHRNQFSVYYKRLEPEAYRLLTALRNGASLELACAEAFADLHELPEHAAAKIQTWFATWMKLGWLCTAGHV